MEISYRINESTVQKICAEIKNSGGNEVFFRGILDEDIIVCDIEVIARGNNYSVPAILNRVKKGEVIIHNHPSGVLYPSDNDIKISSAFGQLGGGSYIINNTVTDIYVVVEPLKRDSKIDISKYFAEDGIISQKFSEFEYRHEQLDMAKFIEKSLNTGQKAIIEAGTGTGKTLAYLVPSLEWAIANNKKVIISTNTINLQEQLLGKDIPLVKKILDKDFKRVLVKGRGNYLCIRKVKNIKDADFDELSPVQQKELTAIIDWSNLTETGDRQELELEPSYHIWEKVASESDLCLKNKCFWKDKCYFMRARREIYTADLMITNHHIYFADLAIRKETGFVTDYGILPNYDLVVFDEAHNIERVSRDYFSHQISRSYFNKLLNNIYNYKGERKKTAGAVTKAFEYLRNNNFEKEKINRLEDFFTTDIFNLHKSLYEKMDDLLLKIISVFSKENQKNEIKVRLRQEILESSDVWKEEILHRKEEVRSTFTSYLKKMTELEDSIEQLEAEDENGFLNDFFKYVKRLEEFYTSFKFIFDMDNEEYVYWVEINNKYVNIAINATPLKIKDELKDVLYAEIENIVFTSATLAVGKSFDYFKDSIGLEEDVLEKVIKSPFNYKEQMRVLIPKDIKSPDETGFNDDATDIIKRLVRKTNGRTFILFTAYSTLNYLYYKMKDELESEGFTLLVQGEYQRHKLLEMFKSFDKAILFGADSFWEGVDVKGEKLSSVIIVKLPFKVPSEPVVEAVIESIQNNGGNSFMEYQIPEAVIKFKQGVGRLIRSKEDKGIITILDSRVITKNYGKLFLEALSDATIVVKSIKDI